MNGDYWPSGLLAELVQISQGGEPPQDIDPERFAEMARRAAKEIAHRGIRNPVLALTQERGERAGFETRLGCRWGRALDLFELTIEESLEDGRWVNSSWRRRAADRQDYKFEALIRLHGRAVMTAHEVLVLLRAGYSTGALARWRTVHEIWVVASLLGERDPELSRRYLVHDAVENMKAEEEYEETWESLGFEPPDWQASERAQIRSRLAEEFGASFLQDYGWASPLFNGRAPRFKHLQELAELDHWRGYYRMASHGTHANSKGISWNIQAGNLTGQLTGPARRTRGSSTRLRAR